MDINTFNSSFFKANQPFSLFDWLGADHQVDENNPLIQQLVGMHEYLLELTDYKDLSNLPPNKVKGLSHQPQFRHQLIETLTQYSIEQKVNPPIDIIQTALSFLDSYNRPAFLVQLHQLLDFDSWMKLFVDFWERCDGCSMYIAEFRTIFADKDIPYLMKTYFPTESYARWQELPEILLVYRGALESCQDGLSWSMDNKVALKFANQYLDMSKKGFSYLRATTQMNFKGMALLDQKIGERASVYAIYVDKNDCLLFIGRSEEEVFVPRSYGDEIEDLIAC